MSVLTGKELRIVGFLCNWCSYGGADTAGVARFTQPTDLRIIRVPCSGRVNPLFPLKALLSGADGVLVSGCHPRDCHYSEGNYYARRRLETLKEFLPIIGIDPRRFEYTWVSASEGQRWQAVVTAFTERVHKLGPAPKFEDAKPMYVMPNLDLPAPLRPLGCGVNPAAMTELKDQIKAALEAKEKGAKVLLIEKMGRPDCTSAYSSGWIAATKTRYQDKDDDSKELYFKEMMEVSGGRSDPALIRAYAEIAGESVDWLGDHGMTYKIWKQHAPERMRCHIVPAVNGLTGGAHMVKVMLEALEKAGVPVRYNTKTVELVTDECFNVLGVSCIEKHRRVGLMTKGGVILATGGFAGNNAMVGQYIGPWASGMVVRGAPWATGENIRMAEQVMARMVNVNNPRLKAEA